MRPHPAAQGLRRAEFYRVHKTTPRPARAPTTRAWGGAPFRTSRWIRNPSSDSAGRGRKQRTPPFGIQLRQDNHRAITTAAKIAESDTIRFGAALIAALAQLEATHCTAPPSRSPASRPPPPSRPRAWESAMGSPHQSGNAPDDRDCGNLSKPVVPADCLPVPPHIAESVADSRPRSGEQTATAKRAFIQQTQASGWFLARCCVATEEDSAQRQHLRSARSAVTLRSLLACAHLALPRGRGSEQ